MIIRLNIEIKLNFIKDQIFHCIYCPNGLQNKSETEVPKHQKNLGVLWSSESCDQLYLSGLCL